MLLFERYFYKKIALFFSLCLLSLLFLYLLIDYSTHFKLIQKSSFAILDIIFYFLARVGKLMEFFIPLAFSLSIVASLGLAGSKNETLALLSSGLSYFRILRPFFISASAISLLLLLHFQFISPLLNAAETKVMEKEIKLTDAKEVQSLKLRDGSTLLFQRYDSKRNFFYDIFWIKNQDEIYRIEKLDAEKVPLGINVELFQRSEGVLKKENIPTRSFPELILSDDLRKGARSYNALSFLELFSEKKAAGLSLFYYRLAASMIPVLMVFVLAPSLMHFSRGYSLYPIFFFALTFLFVFFTITRASLILAKGDVISPFWAIFTPFLIAFGISGIRARVKLS